MLGFRIEGVAVSWCLELAAKERKTGILHLELGRAREGLPAESCSRCEALALAKIVSAGAAGNLNCLLRVSKECVN